MSRRSSWQFSTPPGAVGSPETLSRTERLVENCKDRGLDGADD